MESSDGQQCNSLNASVQTANIHGTRPAMDQLIQEDPSAKRERDGLETDKTPLSTPAPSFSMRDDKLRKRDRSRTEERTQTALSQLPSKTPCDIKREGDGFSINAGLGEIKTPKDEPTSEDPRMTRLLASPPLAPSAACMNGNTEKPHKRPREDSGPLPDAQRRKSYRTTLNCPVMVPCNQSYTVKELRCHKDPDTGQIVVNVTWEESVVRFSALPLNRTWQELEKYLQGDYHELCQQSGGHGICVDATNMGEYMVSAIEVTWVNDQPEITVFWADTEEPLSVLDSDARKTAKKQIIKKYGRKVWKSESRRARLEA